MRTLTIVIFLSLLLVGCAVDEAVPTVTPTSPTMVPSWTPRASPTASLTPSITPTASLVPLPPVISRENLDQLRPLYRFASLGFYHLESDWVVLYDNRQTAIWDLRSAKLLVTLDGRYKAIDGDYLLTVSGERLLLWQVSTGKQVLDIAASQAEFHPIKPWLIVYGTPEGIAQLWDYQTGVLLGEFEEYPEDQFTFSPGGGLLAASGGIQNVVRVWELPKMEVYFRFEDDTASTTSSPRIAITADGRYLLVSGTGDNKIFDLEAGELIWSDTDSWAIYADPDSRYAFVTTEATTRIFDLQDRRYLNRYLLGDTPTFFPEVGLITNHDANWLAYNLYIYRYGSFEQVAGVYLTEGVVGPGSFFPAVNLFMVADQAGMIRFFDMTSWQEVYRLEVEDAGSVYRPQFSRGGHWLLFGWSAADAGGQLYNVFEVWGVPQ